MIKKDTVSTKCKITPLTNIHVGSGVELASYDYIIKDSLYYRIDLGEIFYNFPEKMREELTKLMEDGNIIQIRKYLKDNYKEEYGYIYKCKVTDDVNDEYEKKVAGAKNSNEENQLIVHEFIGNYKGKYIPGSSIKGSLRGAYIGENLKRSYNVVRDDRNKTAPFKHTQKENFLAKEIEAEILGLLELEPKFDPFKNFQVTDTEISNNMLEVTKIKRVNLKNSKTDVPMGFHEVMRGYLLSGEERSLEFKINSSIFPDDENFKNILKRLSTTFDKKTKEKKVVLQEMREFYVDTEIIPILRAKAEKLLEEDLKFFKEANNLKGIEACNRIKEVSSKLKENEALIRFGKGAGFNSTTLNLYNKNKKKIFTRVVSEDYPVGWGVFSCEEE